MATADEYAAWIVKNSDKKGTPAFETVASAYKDARATSQDWQGSSNQADTPARGVTQQVADKAGAVASGANRGILARAGLPFNPVDAIANVRDLVKAGIGYPYSKISGNAPPDWLAVDPRSETVGSGDWLTAQALKTKMGRTVLNAPNPEDQGGYLQALGAGAGGAGRPGMLSGALGSAAGKAAYDATGSDALAVAASMAPVGAKMAGRRALAGVATPNDQRAADLASTAIDKYGIPLNIADVTDSRFLKSARGVMNDTPLLATIGNKQDAGKQPALNREVGKTFGADPNATALTPDVTRAASQQRSAKFDRIWNGNTLEVDQPMFQQLQSAMAEAGKLPAGDRQRLQGWVNDIHSQMTPGQNGAPTIPGEVANRYQSKMRQEIDRAPDGFLKGALENLRGSMLQAFNRSVSPQDAADLTEVRSQHKAFKTVEPLLNKSESGVAGRLSGDVPAGLLSNAVAQSYSNPQGVPLNDLAQIAGRFMVNRTPQTGGSARAMIQNGLVGGGLLTAAGAANMPAAVVGGAGATGLQYLLGNPKALQALLKGGQVTEADIQQLINIPGLLRQGQ